MIGCFRAAPNSGPTSKSLPGPQFSFGLDLVTAPTAGTLRNVNNTILRVNMLTMVWLSLHMSRGEADKNSNFDWDCDVTANASLVETEKWKCIGVWNAVCDPYFIFSNRYSKLTSPPAAVCQSEVSPRADILFVEGSFSSKSVKICRKIFPANTRPERWRLKRQVPVHTAYYFEYNLKTGNTSKSIAKDSHPIKSSNQNPF